MISPAMHPLIWGGGLVALAGTVTGSATNVSGLVAGNYATLQIQGGELYLIVQPLSAPKLTNSVAYSGGTFNLSMAGPNSQSFHLMATTSLLSPITSWRVLTSGIFSADAISYADTNATNCREFYRVVSP